MSFIRLEPAVLQVGSEPGQVVEQPAVDRDGDNGAASPAGPITSPVATMPVRIERIISWWWALGRYPAGLLVAMVASGWPGSRMARDGQPLFEG